MVLELLIKISNFNKLKERKIEACMCLPRCSWSILELEDGFSHLGMENFGEDLA
jgi:hypothetical protein